MNKIILLILLLLGSSSLYAQTRDLAYHSPVPIRAALVNAMLVQPDGKIVVGGDISFFGNSPVKNLIRLNADGTLDETFHFSDAGAFRILDLEIQSTGDILVLEDVQGGGKVLKISPTGAILASTTASNVIRFITVAPDDNVFIGGGSTPGFISRYSPALTIDGSFTASFNGPVWDCQFFDNKIYAAGSFTTVNGANKNSIVRLNSSGAIDNSFDTGTGTSDQIGALTIQPDGKILLGRAYINSFNGTSANGIMRLNNDGSVDTGFYPPALSGTTSAVYIKDNKIYVIGVISGENKVFRLYSNGTPDPSFQEIPVHINTITESCLGFSNTDVIVGGAKSGSKYGFSKYTDTGSLIAPFTPPFGRYGTITDGKCVGGKFIVGGDFFRLDNVVTNCLARLNGNGQVDGSFIFSEDKGIVQQIEISTDQNLLVGTSTGLFKMNNSGQINAAFNFSFFKDLYQVIKFREASNGKIYVGDANQVYRINSNGTEDISYNIGGGKCCITSTNFDFDLQGDKIIYGSAFESFNGVPANRLTRLTSNAAVDPTFVIGSGSLHPTIDSRNTIAFIKVLPSKEILVGGPFTSFNGNPTNGQLIKLSENGSFDNAFKNNLNFSMLTNSFAENFGNKILLGNGIPILINPDGTQEPALSFSNVTFNALRNGVVVNKDSIYLLGQFSITGQSNPSFILKAFINDKPKITGVSISSGQEDTAIQLSPALFTIDDDNDLTPQDFTVTLLGGSNYTVTGNTIVPKTNYFGPITITVTVHDGTESSSQFSFPIELASVNDAPEIKGITHSFIREAQPVLLNLADFTIQDADNLPADFTLTIMPGSNYSINGKSVVPAPGYYGELMVSVVVSDGATNSQPFKFPITINDIPRITGVKISTGNEDVPVLFSTELVIIDDDNDLSPQDFTLTILSGQNYTVSGSTIVPKKDYNGVVTVTISVHDGVAASEPFTFNIDIAKVNDAPKITSLKTKLTGDYRSPILLSPDLFTVEDVDNVFPADFTLTVLPGNNYSVNGTTVVPADKFAGELTVTVTVNDGTLNSEPFAFPVILDPVTSLNSESLAGVEVYPNPASESITVNFGNISGSHSLMIYDITGHKLYQRLAIKESEAKADVLSYHPGPYILRIQSGNNMPTYFKFFKE